MSTELENKEKRIRALLAGMAKLGAMRPGTLTVQYRNPAEKMTPFNQLSYTHKGRSRSEYVRSENLVAVRREVETYKKFRILIEEVTELSLEASRLRHKRE
jgi:superfamily I DNA and/or RNA helicase